MKLGMFTCGWQRWPLERVFSGARRLGYDYIELWGGRPHAFAPDLRRGGLREVLALEEKYQMPVAVYTPEHNAYPYNYMLGDRQQWEDCMAYLELCLEMGKALGAEYTLISVGHGGYGASRQALWNRLLESLRRLADAAERLGHLRYVPWISFTIPDGAEQVRGYLSYTLDASRFLEPSDIHPDDPENWTYQDNWYVFLRHQAGLLQYPFHDVADLGGEGGAGDYGPIQTVFGHFEYYDPQE